MTKHQPTSKSQRRIEPLMVSNGLAVGLRRDEAAFLCTFTREYGCRSALSRCKSTKASTKVVQLCEDILHVVGIGEIDNAFLGHYIRQTVFVATTSYDPLFWASSQKPTAVRLAEFLAADDSVQAELTEALQQLKNDSSRIQSRRFRTAFEMTEAWVRNGGARAYGFALAIVHDAAIGQPSLLRTISADDFEGTLKMAYSEAALPWPHSKRSMRPHDLLPSDRSDLSCSGEIDDIEAAIFTFPPRSTSPKDRREAVIRFCGLLRRGERRYMREYLARIDEEIDTVT